MIKFYAALFIDLQGHMTALRAGWDLCLATGSGCGSRLCDIDEFKAQLEKGIAECKLMSFDTTALSGQRLLDALSSIDVSVKHQTPGGDAVAVPPHTARFILRRIDEFRGRIYDDTSLSHYFRLDTRQSALWQPAEPLFGKEVAAKFPSLLYEVDEGAKCLALGRSTAAVFHLMRAMEIVLKAVAACIGVTPPKNPNWGSWLTAIKGEIEQRSPRGAAKWAKHDLFQDFYNRIDAVKDAQRNSTLHVERVYTETEAADVFSATRAFVQKVASEMDEQGHPRA